MANSDKNIRISTNKDTTALPKIVFTGQGNLPITLNVLDDNTLSFEGSSGQLFSINNVLSTGYIFSINDISGIPSFRVNADGTVGIAEFLGNVGIGLTNPAYKLQVSGSAGISGTANISGVLTLSSTIGSGSTTTGALVVSGGVGIGGSIFSSSAYASSLSGVVFNNGAITNTGTITSTGTMSISNSSTTAFSVRDGSNNPAFTIDTIGDIISLPVAIASTSTGTGSLVVAGGVGIGGSVNVGGRVGIGTNLLSGQLNIKTSLAATPGLVVQGAASQTADYAQFFTSTGTTSLSITKDAEIKFPLAQDIKIYATPYASVGAIKTTGNFFALGGLIFAYGVSDSLSGSLSPTQLLISGLDWTTYSSGSSIRWATNNPVRIQPTGTSVVPLHINLNNASWTSGNSFEIANNGDLRFSIDYTGSTKILSTVGSGSTTTGALVVTGGVGIGGSLNVNSASSISGVRIDSGILYGNLTGTATTAGFATTANYSNQSGYGLTSGFATTSTYSHQAGYAITSGSTGSATTSTYAHQSGYATTSGLATTATYSYQAGYGITAGLATTATYSLQSGYATTSGLANTATNVYVNSAGNANASHPILFTPSSSSSGSAVSSDATISFNPSTEILNVSGLAITSGTASTNSSTGALIVDGGVGISGNLYVGNRPIDFLGLFNYNIGGFAVSHFSTVSLVIQNSHPGIGNNSRLVLRNDTTGFSQISYSRSNPSQTYPNRLLIENNSNGDVHYAVLTGYSHRFRNGGTGIFSFTINETSASVGLITASTGSTTGALTVAGGAGIAKTSYFGQSVFIEGTTASGSTTTGALVVTGGVGIGGSLFTSSSNASSISGVILNNGAITNTGTITSTGVMTLSNSSTTAFQVRDGSNNARLSVDTVGGVISISSSTASGSTTTGALTVSGGVGIGGSVNIGRQLTVSGTTRINSSVFNNPLTSSIGASLVQSGYIFGSFWTGLQLENGYLIYGRKVPGGSIIIEEPLTGAQVGGTGNVFAEALQHFKWGNDKYVVLASSGNSVLYSTSLVGDGNSWYYATLPTTASWQKLEYGNNRFIAIATGSTSAYSLDGINWTLSTLPGNYTWSDIKHGNGVFVAGTGSTVAYTYDGIEWTIASNNVASTYITFGNGIFFANSTSNTASYSRDGISWTNTTLPSDTHRASAYGNGVFVNVGNSTTSYYSTDLINWVSGPGGSDGTTPALLYFNNLFYFKENGSGYGKVVTGPTGTLDFSSRYTGEINNVRIGAITPGAAEFTALAAVGPVRFVSDTASTNYKSGSVVVSGGVGIGGSLYVSSATAISGVTINNGVITGSLTGTASTATYSYQSGYAITSGTATTATYAHQSGYATTSGLATTSTYAYQSGYATTSGLATTATYSIQSGYAITSGSSGSATTANNINVVSATANSAHTLLFSPTATGSGVAVSSNTTLSYNPSTNVLSTSGLAITSTTASTSTATGALQVAGGVGISGRLSFNQASFGTTGISTNPTMAMIGNTGDPIFMSVLEDNTISFEGSQGQLFSITPNLSTGYIYSVNDITGIPLIRANANANVTANEYAGNFGIGITNPGYKLHVVGSVGFTSTTASTSTSTGTLVVSGGVGIGGSLYVASATAISGVTINNGVITGNLTGTATTATTATTAITVSVASAGSSNFAHSVLLTPNSSSGSAISSDATITFNPSTEILSVSGLAVTSTTGSSTTTTGALIVSGGVGIGGSFNVGNKTRFNDEVYINTLSNNALYSTGSGGVAYNWAVGGNLSSSKYFLGSDLGLHPVGGNQSVVQTFWGMQLVGNSLTVPSSYTPSSVGTRDAIGVLVPNQQGSKVAFGIIANASQTADLQIWTSSTASTSSPYLAVKADGQIYSYITTPSTSYNTGALVVSGGVGIGGSLFVNGDLTINGTTTTINSVTISVDDKNIELGSVASPSDVTAEGGGITLKGTTDKFINWYSGVGWSSSESWNLVAGSTYKINGTNVLTSTALGTGVTNSSLTSVGTITSGTWAGTTITAHYGGTGLTTPFTVGDLLYANSSTTWARLPANSNSGYVLTSAGSGSTPVYASASSITTGSATTAFNVNVVLATSNANHSLLFSPSLGTASGAAVSNDSTLVFNPSTEILSASGLAVTSSAATTSSSSGALIVTGGVGIGGSVIVGGRVGIGTAPNLSMLNIQTASAGTTGLSISASSSQSAPLLEWWSYGGIIGLNQSGRIKPTGELYLGLQTVANLSSGTNPLFSLQGRGSTEGMLIKGFNSGASEVIFEVQGNTTAQLFGIYGDGGVNAPRINVTNSTGSTSTSSGALIVTGGVGIGGSLNVSSASSISGVTFNSGVITGTLSGYATTSNNLRISSAGSSNLSHSVLFSPNSSTSGSAVSSDSTFTFNSSTEILSVSGLAITNTTSSTSTTTGALTVAGGVGIAGTVNILGDETVNGRLYYSQSTVGTAASSVIPSIMFVGQNNNPITLSVLADNTLSFEGSSGQLFSINNNLSSGTIFSVNDISGIPIIRANANGTLSMGEFTGTVGVGLTNPSFKFQVSGSAGFSGTVYVTGNSAFASTTASTSTSTGALTVSGGVGIGGSLNVNSASLISSVILSSGTVIGNLTGIATTASYAYQSGYGLTSGLATTATYALQSGYAITSGSSSFATTAGFATTSTYSLQSGYGITAGLATTATYALQSGYAITSGSSSFATTSGFATTASYSYQSGYGITAGFATSATSASVANTSYSVNVNAASANSSHYLIFSPSATGSGVALSTETALVYNPSTDILSVSGLAVTSSLGSTSTSTGALRITGGVGIGGSLYSGSILTAGRLQNQSFSGAAVGATDGRMGNYSFTSGHDRIIYGNGIFLTNSSWGAYNSAYSTDGLNWNSSSLPVNQGYPVNMYGNGYFVLVATGATNVMYSTNGSSWSQTSIGNTASRISGAYGNGKFVVVGNGVTYNYSTNVTTWSTGTLPFGNDWLLVYGNGMFVALGYASNDIIYSYDGINWNTGVINSLGRNFRRLSYGNGIFMATSYSTQGTFYSYDGINWYLSAITGGNEEGVAYGNGVYLVNNVNGYKYSTDGLNWSSGFSFGAEYESAYAAYGLNKFVTYGRTLDGPTNTVTIDPEFTGEINNVRIGAITPGSGDFTNLSSTGSANLVGTVNANNLNVLSKINQTPVLGGFSGTTGWTFQNVLTNPVHALTFGNGSFVSIRRNSNTVNVSSDGNRWKASTMPFSGSWLDLAWGKDKFVAVASVGTTGAYSANGISWTSMNMPATAQGWYAVAYGDDKFVSVGSTSTAAYSSDGITWSGSSIANTNWTGIAYGNGTFVAVAGVGQSGAYSYDGINWNLVNLPTATGGAATKFITYGNGYFVVTNYVSTSINYSRDGINWFTSTRSSGFSIHTDLAYGNGIYNILNYNEASFSYDGINWLNSNNITSTDWQAVAYGNNRFVATSINTGNVATIDGPSNTLNLYPKFTGDIDNVRMLKNQDQQNSLI